MASKLTTFTKKLSKMLGKEFDLQEIRDVVKSRKLLGSTAEDASNVVKEVIENRRAIASTFDDAIEIGANNKLFLGEDSQILKNYEKHRSKNRKKDISVKRALEDFNGKEKKPKTTPNDPEAKKFKELKEKRVNQVLEIEQQRVKDSSTTYNAGDGGGSSKSEGPKAKSTETPEEKVARIKRELEKSKMKGKGAPESTVADSEPFEAMSNKQFQKERFANKDMYMKAKVSASYQEAIDAAKIEDFDNPIFKKLNINKDTSINEIRALREKAIKEVSGKDMGFTDVMGYHKIPQKATGTVGTLWLVNKLASSNGEQTNAQLYGQAPY